MKFIVSIPLVGAIHIEVTAESEGAAKDAAWDAYNDHGELAGDIEWELVDEVTSGNVSHAPLNETEVNKVKP